MRSERGGDKRNMKEYVEVNEKKCNEVHNCMCVKEEEDGKTYCRGCGNVQPKS